MLQRRVPGRGRWGRACGLHGCLTMQISHETSAVVVIIANESEAASKTSVQGGPFLGRFLWNLAAESSPRHLILILVSPAYAHRAGAAALVHLPWHPRLPTAAAGRGGVRRMLGEDSRASSLSSGLWRSRNSGCR